MSYPNDLLASRAVVKPGLWAVIPKDGLVNNVIPGIENCRISIVASPKMGASFVQYVVEAHDGGGTVKAWAAEASIESFLYCMSGTLEVTVDGETKTVTDGGYVFAPEGCGISFKSQGESRLLLYKQVYIPVEGSCAYTVWDIY